MSNVCRDLLAPNLTKSDVAELFGVSVRTVSSWIAQGKIVPTRIAGSVRFSLVDMAQLIADGRDPRNQK